MLQEADVEAKYTMNLEVHCSNRTWVPKIAESR